ncbi:MAG: alginate lyase family protein [Anaerolineales bacterium]
MSPSRITTAIKALRHLGFTQVALNALYRFGLKTGHYKRIENREQVTNHLLSNSLFSFPPKEQIIETLGADGLQSLRAEAGEIVAGKFRQFGGEPVEINLTPPAPLAHWTDYETGQAPLSTLYSPLSDIKFTWEPARFGWAFALGRAWHVTGDEQYAAAFWRHFETFQAANPPYMGPNWMSGQEVAIRLMAFAWAAQIFSGSQHSTHERLLRLAESITHHALRIPVTLLYARSQNNNHLLTEAAALYTASLALPDHPRAPQWRATGQQWLTWCFTRQIDAYGEYVQHSMNYHRLMLQTALWLRALTTKDIHAGTPKRSFRAYGWMNPENLALATHWLLSLLDPDSGRVPNLGANDGALLFPLSTQPFDDFRPVAQAAARAFLDYSLPSGPWDEMSLWFGLPRAGSQLEIPRYPGDHLYAPHSWGCLRAVRYKSRPSHADQLHFDLWWRGLNIAQDAGTYLYNADPPWDNRLTSTLVHNTVSVDGREQMTRASRFLYLDWADASSKRHFETDADFAQRVSARTYAYARIGVRHDRMVTVFHDERWQVQDELLNLSLKPHTFRLHWLLPDWEYEIEKREERLEIRLKSPQGWIVLHIQPSLEYHVSLVRAGEYLLGSGAPDPVRGWVSPTYAQKVPALSLAIDVESSGNVTFTSEFTFPAIIPDL